MNGDDRDLHAYFKALRREEETRIPSFSKVSNSARRRGRGRSRAWWAAAAACLTATIAVAAWALVGILSSHERLNREREQAAASMTTASITTWKPATDFLLDTPGRKLLQGVPAIGEWPGAAIAPGSGDRKHHVRSRVLP